METIGTTEVWSFLGRTAKSRPARNAEIRKAEGHQVDSFLELARKVAELQFLNRDYVLLFRGQGKDYRNQKGYSSLKPKLFRSDPGGPINPGPDDLIARFIRLADAERILIDKYEHSHFLGLDRIRRHRIIRWSFLQHYEVCPTPLLDVTHSLRISASFASHNSDGGQAFVFVLGVPNLSGSVTASAESGLQIIRLSSVCPPSAVRPHIQEGYLLGEYPEMSGYEQKLFYHHHEIDFGRRLVAKFSFHPKKFWKPDRFSKIPKRLLYPNAHDPVFEMTNGIRKQIGG